MTNNHAIPSPNAVLDRSTPPPFYAIKPFKLIDPQRVEFANGAKAFFFHAGEQDLVRIEWIFPNDYRLGEDPLVPSCVPPMVLEGTAHRTNAAIADLVDFHGAYLIPEFNSDYSTLTLFTLNKHLSALLPVVRDVLTNAVFPERELNTYLRNRRQRLEVSLQRNDMMARRLFNGILFGNTRYGKSPDLESFDGITAEQLQVYYGQQFRPENCTIIVAGKVTPDVQSAVQDVFDAGGWSATSEPAASVNSNRDTADHAASAPVFPLNPGQLHVETRPDALQSAIRLGFRTIQRNHTDFPGLQFVNTALGGYFGSRLMANIREDKGYTYGIGSGIVSLKHAGYFTIATEVGVDVTEAALREIAHEIQRIKAHPLPAEEMELVRNYLMGNLLGRLENVFSHADHFKQVYFSGLSLAYYDDYQQTILGLDAATVQQLANQYLDYDTMEKVVVGKLT